MLSAKTAEAEARKTSRGVSRIDWLLDRWMNERGLKPP